MPFLYFVLKGEEQLCALVLYATYEKPNIVAVNYLALAVRVAYYLVELYAN